MNDIKLYVFNILVLCITLTGSHEEYSSNTPTDFLLCRHCGYNIASAATVINFKSPAAEDIQNQTLFGLKNVEVQSLRNPLGIQFNVITAKGGTCIAASKRWQTEDSWYPGYAWKACKCSRCSKLIGWVFEPLATADTERLYASVNGLYAFILDNIISEAYSDSLLITPKLH